MIRIANPDTDYEQIATLINLVEANPVTADQIRSWDSRENTILRRFVAVDDQNQVIGYGNVVHAPWATAGHYYVYAITDPAHRRRGIGRLLYEHALQFALDQGAIFLDSETREDCPEGLDFAQKRGFTIDHHLFESAINLKTFDASRFAGTIEKLEAQGFRFFSLADVGDTEAARRQLWHVNYQTHLDDPASAGTFPSFEELQDIWAKSDWFVPEGQILAAYGDEYVGLAAVGYFKTDNSMYNLMTGVMPAYRGRGLAQALKLISIRFAQQYGANEIRTDNDSTNAPMLAVNRKLGYIPRPGIYRLVRDLKG